MLMVVPLEIEMPFGIVEVERKDDLWWQNGSMILKMHLRTIMTVCK